MSGDLAARLGLARAWLVAMLGLALATALLAIGTGNPVAVFVATGGFGAAYIVLTALLLLRATVVYAGSPAFGVGAAFLVLALGQAMGAPAIGALLDHLGPMGAFSVASGIAVLGAGCWLRPVRRRAMVSVPSALSEREPCLDGS